MATATSTITPSLTPSQQAAREFWRQAGADGMPPFYVMSQYYAQLNANSDNLPAVTAALEQLLTGLGYATDVDTVFGELAAGQEEELGYWAGRYCLFDSDGNRFDFVVGRDGATLTVPPALVDVTSLPAGTDMASVTVLSSVGFSNGVLQLANANALLPREISSVRLQASLSFSLPVSDATLDAGAAAFQSTAPLCKGTFVVSGGGSAGLRPVNGKRGAWTQAGVNQAADGDPKEAWYGQYVLLDVTDVTAVKQDPNPVYIYDDPDAVGLTFQWGQDDDANTKYSGKASYNNNVLQCPDDSDPDTQYAMQFIAPQAGAAEINLAVITKGAVSSYKGYWVGSYPPPSLPTSQAHLATTPITAVYNAASDASAGGYSQTIDVSSLTAGGNTTIKLPDGAVGNTYALTLNLTGCAASDKFSWTVSGGATDGAAIAPSGDANQTVKFSLANLSTTTDGGQPLQATVQLTKTSATKSVTYTLRFEIAVIKCDAISLEPTVLPPIVVGTAYTQNLVAKGANTSFTWSVDASSLPPGLRWDPSSHHLSGTVTDATQVGKAFHLVVTVTASDVIMDPLTAQLNITVQSASAVASGVPLWEKILIFASPGILALVGIAAFALSRLLKGKANPKTVETIETGWTIIDKATHGDPKSASVSILQADKITLRKVRDNIPDIESLFNKINQEEDAFSRQISLNDPIIARLENYVEGHRDADPNGMTEDPQLYHAGYETNGEVASGYHNLIEKNLQLRDHLNGLGEYSNYLRTNIASAEERIIADDSSESSDERFVGGKEG